MFLSEDEGPLDSGLVPWLEGSHLEDGSILVDALKDSSTFSNQLQKVRRKKENDDRVSSDPRHSVDGAGTEWPTADSLVHRMAVCQVAEVGRPRGQGNFFFQWKGEDGTGSALQNEISDTAPGRQCPFPHGHPNGQRNSPPAP